MTADFKQAATLIGKVLASGSLNPASWTVSFAGSPTGGTFTIAITTGLNGTSQATQSASITYSTTLTAASIQTTLQALPGLSTVTVSGANGGPFTITVPNALGASLVAITAQALSGGTSPNVTAAGSGSETSLYTVPAASAVKVASCSITNGTALTATVSVAVIPSGGTLGDGTHKVLLNYSLAPYDTISHQDVLSTLIGAFLDAGAQFAVSSTTAVTYLLTGAVSA